MEIIKGNATRWDPETQRMIVKIGSRQLAYVPADQITIYPEYSIMDNGYSRAAAYCIGIELDYAVIKRTPDEVILSRKILAELTLEKLENEKYHDFVECTITGVEPKVVYLDYNGVYGMCPAQSLTYTYLSNCGIVFNRGEKFTFAILGIKDDKLELSRIVTIPTKSELLEQYKPGQIISGILLSPVNNKCNDPGLRSWFFITEQTIPGIVEIPERLYIKTGRNVSIIVKKITPKGLRGDLGV